MYPDYQKEKDSTISEQYRNSGDYAQKTPEHLDFSRKFAHDIYERFTPEQQNEILFNIKNHIGELRQKDINTLQDKIDKLLKCQEEIFNK